MNATAQRPASPADLRIVQLTQHWTIEHGAFYRDAIVELPDGSLRLVGIRDDLVPVAA
jgi:hypothetical protein